MLGAVRVTAESLDDLVTRLAKLYHIEPALVKAVIRQESNWDVNASRYEAHLNDTSWGLMQVLLKTARWILGNENLTIQELIKPDINISAGAKYLGTLLAKYGNVRDALASYNAGSPRRNKDGSYVNQEYVDKVYRNYMMYQVTEPIRTVASSPIGITALLGIGAIGLVFAMGRK